MKKNYIFTMLLLTLCSAISFAQVSYSGNGNSGFGGPVGNATMTINDDGTTITFTFTKGAGDFNDTMAMYISTGATGRNVIDGDVNDTADSNRRAISNTGSGNLTLPTGFNATYGIAINTGFGGLWSIPATGTINSNGLVFVSAVGSPAANTTASFTFSFTWANIGLTNTDKFDFVITYGNSNDGGGANMFSSDEAFGDGIGGGNPGLAAMTYTDSKSYPNTWTGTTDTDWATATNWTEGLPTVTHNVYIPKVANQPIATADVTINKGVVKSGASLIPQSNFTGTITYDLAIPDTNWHLVSSPVVGETYNDDWITANSIASGVTIPNNRGISTYDNDTDANGDWVYFQTGGTETTFTSGAGYSLLRTGAGNYSFTGTVPTTDVSTSISRGFSGNNRWNLVGNPFPSYIDVTAFLTANAAALTDTNEAVYIWNGTIYQEITTGFIHPGQAFFVNAENVGATNITVTEAMLSGQTGTAFLKNNNPSIALSIENGTTKKETTINYLADKTTGLDPRFDVGRFTGSSNNGTAGSFEVFTQLLENNEGVDFVRQTLPNSNFESMVVPVGITADAGKEITFTADAQNLPSGINVYLEDRQLNTFTRLDEANANYKVTLADASNGTGRFYMHTASRALSTDSEILSTVSIYKTNNSNLRIAGLQNGNASVKIFNILGKQVLQQSFTANGPENITLPNLASGIYIVQLQNEAGSISKKIILE